MTFRLRIKNLKAVERAARKFTAGHGKAALESYLLMAGNIIMTQSIKNAPREFGDLRASGYVRITEGSAKRMKIELGHSEEYALPVHERIRDHRSGKVINHPEGGAKFLTRAIEEKTQEAKARGLEAAREAIRTGRINTSSDYPYRPPGGDE